MHHWITFDWLKGKSTVTKSFKNVSYNIIGYSNCYETYENTHQNEIRKNLMITGK